MKRLVRNRKFQKKEVRFTKGDLRLGFTKYGLNLPITINQFYPERSRRERLTSNIWTQNNQTITFHTIFVTT